MILSTPTHPCVLGAGSAPPGSGELWAQEAGGAILKEALPAKPESRTSKPSGREGGSEPLRAVTAGPTRSVTQFQISSP